MEPKRVVFMGTPEIAAGVFEKLIALQKDHDFEVVLAVTQPDKKRGRKQILIAPPVKESAMAHGIPVFQPAKIRQEYQPLLDARPDLIVTCAYGQLIPQILLDAPVCGCINLHGSLLPEYRGGAPIQRAIWDGRKESGMSLMKLVAKMDAGPVMDMDRIPIEEEDTSTTLFEKMTESACRLLEKNIDLLLSGRAVYTEQDESLATFAPVISREEEHLDLSQEDERILHQIRALSVQPGAYVIAGGRKLKILDAEYRKETPAAFGVLEEMPRKNLVLGLKEGNLWLREVQMEGKPVMNIHDFMNGQGRNLSGTKIQ